MSFSLPKLPYTLDALEPYISKDTLSVHYGKHHKKYVETLNQLIKGTSFEDMTLEEVVLESFPNQKEVFNNAAQAWNHTFFWNCLTPDKNEISKELKQKMVKAYGSFESFKAEFIEAGTNHFGSGWVWLSKDASGDLIIDSLHDAENPLVHDHTPLLTCDLWEHAYYLDYQNERPKFLKNFWNRVNWEFVNENFERASHNPIVRPTPSVDRTHRHTK